MNTSRNSVEEVDLITEDKENMNESGLSKSTKPKQLTLFDMNRSKSFFTSDTTEKPKSERAGVENKTKNTKSKTPNEKKPAEGEVKKTINQRQLSIKITPLSIETINEACKPLQKSPSKQHEPIEIDIAEDHEQKTENPKSDGQPDVKKTDKKPTTSEGKTLKQSKLFVNSDALKFEAKKDADKESSADPYDMESMGEKKSNQEDKQPVAVTRINITDWVKQNANLAFDSTDQNQTSLLENEKFGDIAEIICLYNSIVPNLTQRPADYSIEPKLDYEKFVHSIARNDPRGGEYFARIVISFLNIYFRLEKMINSVEKYQIDWVKLEPRPCYLRELTRIALHWLIFIDNDNTDDFHLFTPSAKVKGYFPVLDELEKDPGHGPFANLSVNSKLEILKIFADSLLATKKLHRHKNKIQFQLDELSNSKKQKIDYVISKLNITAEELYENMSTYEKTVEQSRNSRLISSYRFLKNFSNHERNLQLELERYLKLEPLGIDVESNRYWKFAFLDRIVIEVIHIIPERPFEQKSHWYFCQFAQVQTLTSLLEKTNSPDNSRLISKLTELINQTHMTVIRSHKTFDDNQFKVIETVHELRKKSALSSDDENAQPKKRILDKHGRELILDYNFPFITFNTQRINRLYELMVNLINSVRYLAFVGLLKVDSFSDLANIPAQYAQFTTAEEKLNYAKQTFNRLSHAIKFKSFYFGFIYKVQSSSGQTAKSFFKLTNELVESSKSVSQLYFLLYFCLSNNLVLHNNTDVSACKTCKKVLVFKPIDNLDDIKDHEMSIGNMRTFVICYKCLQSYHVECVNLATFEKGRALNTCKVCEPAPEVDDDVDELQLPKFNDEHEREEYFSKRTLRQSTRAQRQQKEENVSTISNSSNDSRQSKRKRTSSRNYELPSRTEPQRKSERVKETIKCYTILSSSSSSDNE